MSEEVDETVQSSDTNKILSASDEHLIEIAQSTCMLHRYSEELGFLVVFDLNDLKKFVDLIKSTSL